MDYATRKRPAYARRNADLHFVFTIYLESKRSSGFKKAQINFVEHADTLLSKSLKGGKGIKKPGMSISDMALRSVICCLGDGNKDNMVPYSDSKFTWYLQKSFCG